MKFTIYNKIIQVQFFRQFARRIQFFLKFYKESYLSSPFLHNFLSTKVGFSLSIYRILTGYQGYFTQAIAYHEERITVISRKSNKML